MKGKKLMMLRDPISIVAENLSKLGNPKDLSEIIANQAGFELDKDIEIPNSHIHEEAIESVHLPSQSVAESMSTKPAPFVQPSVMSSQIPMDMPNDNFMPIKALNTFTRDWVIKARVSSKGEMRQTKAGGSIMKIELVDSYGT